MGLFFLNAAQAADCAPTFKAYANSRDKFGTEIPLAHQCENASTANGASVDQVCVYLNETRSLAAVTGTIRRWTIPSQYLNFNGVIDNSDVLAVRMKEMVGPRGTRIATFALDRATMIAKVESYVEELNGSGAAPQFPRHQTTVTCR